MSRRSPVVVLVGFGASSAEARRVYAHIEGRVRESLTGHEIRWAFTSGRISAKLRGDGVVLPTLPETMEDLDRRGVDGVVFQPLLTVPGQEYNKLLQVAGNGRRWRIGGPLLDSGRSVGEVIDALEPALRQDSVNVLVCHGNRRHAEYNDRLLDLSRAMESRYGNVVVASVEGSPGQAPLERARRLAQTAGSIHFVPFMLVAGEHIANDVMGDHPDSWKNRAGAARVSCAPSLGWNPGIVRLYLRRLNAAIDERERVHP